MDDRSDNRGLRRLLESGTDIASGAIGGALGFLATGTVGAAALGAGGAGIAQALSRIGSEISDRLLGPRERARVGAVLAMSASNIHDRLNRGATTRQDGFFEVSSDGRAKAEEVAENVLLKSQREPEERKLPYMATLLSNVAFDETISVSLAHQLIKTAESLTYRQFCLLKLTANSRDRSLHATYTGQTSFPGELLAVLYECYDLNQRGLITNGKHLALAIPDLDPSEMRPQGLGAHLYNHMGLNWIPETDVGPLQRILQ